MARSAEPQNLQAERIVLCAVFLDNLVIDSVRDLLPPEAFYEKRHRIIFEHMLSMSANGKQIDIVTLSDGLRTAGLLQAAGGGEYLAKIQKETFTEEGIEAYAQIIFDHSRRREEIRFLHEERERLYEGGTADDLAEIYEQRALSLRNSLAFNSDDPSMSHASKIFPDLTEELQAGKRVRESLIPFFLPTINRALGGGFPPGSLVVLLGGTGDGKTTLMGQQAEYTAFKNIPTAIIALEQRTPEIQEMLLGQVSKIPGEIIRNRSWKDDAQKQKALQAAAVLSGWNLYVLGLDRTNPTKSWSDMRRLMEREKVRSIVIDHLQLLTESEKNSDAYTYRVKDVTRRLKLMAGHYGAVILLVCQLQENAARPMAWGSVVPLQDADAVLVYQRTKRTGHAGQQDSIDLHKNRLPGGQTPRVPIRWDSVSNRIAEIETTHEPRAPAERPLFGGSGDLA